VIPCIVQPREIIKFNVQLFGLAFISLKKNRNNLRKEVTITSGKRDYLTIYVPRLIRSY
jgi:hypothetical protein